MHLYDSYKILGLETGATEIEVKPVKEITSRRATLMISRESTEIKNTLLTIPGSTSRPSCQIFWLPCQAGSPGTKTMTWNCSPTTLSQPCSYFCPHWHKTFKQPLICWNLTPNCMIDLPSLPTAVEIILSLMMRRVWVPLLLLTSSVLGSGGIHFENYIWEIHLRNTFEKYILKTTFEKYILGNTFWKLHLRNTFWEIHFVWGFFYCSLHLSWDQMESTSADVIAFSKIWNITQTDCWPTSSWCRRYHI